MAGITQDMKFRQSLLSYAEKYGAGRAARKYETNRQYVYRWRQRYNGGIGSLGELSRRTHGHTAAYTAEEAAVISAARTENPSGGPVIFWARLTRKGYARSVTGLYRFMRGQNLSSVKPDYPRSL
jgi:hypothetical protein